MVPSADVAELDPTRAANQIGRIYSQMVFDTLYALDHTLSPKPMMVDKETISPDGLTYVFTLRPGLKFHDGTPVTTRDVAASLTHWMNGSATGGELKSRLDAMSVQDDLTFTLKLKQRFGLLEFLLAGAGAPIAGIMREADANRPDNVPLTNPVGSGPFRYVAAERVSGHRVVFDRNPDYISRPEPPDGAAGGRHVKFARVEWNIIPDPTTAANALATGEADFWDTVTPDMVPFLKQRGIIVRRTAALPSVAWIRPNFELPPFNDPRARQALALLVDQKEFMEAVAGDTPWTTCYSFSVCGSLLGTEVGSEPYRKTDVAKAKQLLAEAGYKGDPVVVVGTPQLPIINIMTQLLAQRLRDAGMNVDMQMGDWATIYTRMNTPHLHARPRLVECRRHLLAGRHRLQPADQLGARHLLRPRIPPAAWAGPAMPRATPCARPSSRLPTRPRARPRSRRSSARMWQFIPFVPAGQFDQQNAYSKNISGVLSGYVIIYWNMEKS